MEEVAAMSSSPRRRFLLRALVLFFFGAVASLLAVSQASTTPLLADRATASTYERIVIDGSSSAHRLLWTRVQQLRAELPNVFITLGVGGTGRGIDRLLRREVDLAVASRALTDAERARVPEEDPLLDCVLGHDHVSVIVAASSPVRSMKWLDLGEALLSAQAHLRRILPEQGSGTRAILAAHLGVNPADFIAEVEATSELEILDYVIQDNETIGVLGSAYVGLRGPSSVRELAMLDDQRLPQVVGRPLYLLALRSQLDRRPAAKAFFGRCCDLAAMPAFVVDGYQTSR